MRRILIWWVFPSCLWLSLIVAAVFGICNLPHGHGAPLDSRGYTASRDIRAHVPYVQRDGPIISVCVSNSDGTTLSPFVVPIPATATPYVMSSSGASASSPNTSSGYPGYH